MEWPEKALCLRLKMSLVKYWERRWHCSVNGGDEKENSALGEEGTNWTRISEEESRRIVGFWDKPSKLS